MSNRIVYGNTFSSNGWPMVDEGSCTWVTIPGTDPTVTIEIQNGQPLQILRAFVADINAYVESVRDADTACWTATNSVSTSNHLSGTAVDIDWNSHPFQIADAGWNPDQIAAIRKIIDFYEGTVWWGNDWDDPKDAMHFQLGSVANGGDIDTYGNPHTQDFINRKIRPDGFSIFGRGDAPATPPAAQVLARATGLPDAKVSEILSTLQEGLKLAQCNTVNRVAMFIAQTRHESDNYNTTEEYDKNGRYAPYIGRTWIQITWESNYADFGQWCVQQGLIQDPNQFVNDPQSLADMQWAGVGAAWYWTVQRPQINSMCDQGDINGVTYAINGGYNGLDQRTAYWNQALAVGDDLLALTGTPSGDDMAQVPQDQWDRVYQELTKEFPSRSLYRSPDEGLVDTGFGFVLNLDGMTHQQFVERLASLGDTDSLTRIAHVAAGQGADTSDWAISHAKAVLANIEATNPAVLKNFLAQNGTQA